MLIQIDQRLLYHQYGIQLWFVQHPYFLHLFVCNTCHRVRTQPHTRSGSLACIIIEVNELYKLIQLILLDMLPLTRANTGGHPQCPGDPSLSAAGLLVINLVLS